MDIRVELRLTAGCVRKQAIAAIVVQLGLSSSSSCSTAVLQRMRVGQEHVIHSRHVSAAS